MKIYEGLGQLLDGRSFIADRGKDCRFERLQKEEEVKEVKVIFDCSKCQWEHEYQLNLSQFDVTVFLYHKAPDGSLEEIEKREVEDVVGVIIVLRGGGEAVRLLFEVRSKDALHIRSKYPCLFNKGNEEEIKWSGTLLI